MPETEGHCKHGEFILTKGCPDCIQEARDRKIVKVQYYSETTGELSAREYTYYSAERLSVGDIVIVPVRDTTGKAKVSAIDVPIAEIAAFKDSVKTIPAGAKTEPRAKPAPDAAQIAEAGKAVDIIEAQERKAAAALPADGAAINITEELLEETAAETALALRPGEDIEAHGYFKESLKILEYAKSRVIATVDDNKIANDDLSIISRLKKAMESKRKERLDPLEAEKQAIRDTYNYLMAPVLEAEKITKTKMLAYDAEQRRIRVEQEEINRKRQEAAEAEMRLKGELTESVNLVEVVPEPAKSVSTDMGSTGMVDCWKYEIIDVNLIPREYMMPDTSMLNNTAKAHHDKKLVAGVRFYNEPYIATRVR